MLTFVVSLTNFEDLKMCVHDILSSPKSPKCCPSRLKVCVWLEEDGATHASLLLTVDTIS